MPELRPALLRQKQTHTVLAELEDGDLGSHEGHELGDGGFQQNGTCRIFQIVPLAFYSAVRMFFCQVLHNRELGHASEVTKLKK